MNSWPGTSPNRRTGAGLNGARRSRSAEDSESEPRHRRERFRKDDPPQGVALASLGPAVADSGLFPYYLIRRESGRPAKGGALIEARYTLNDQDRKGEDPKRQSGIDSRIRVERRGDLERFKWVHEDEDAWHPIYSKSSDALFLVGYGASLQVEAELCASVSLRPGAGDGSCGTRRSVPAFRFGMTKQDTATTPRRGRASTRRPQLADRARVPGALRP